MIFFSETLFAQKEQFSDYYFLRSKYENRSENDSTVVPLVLNYISKAKVEKQYKRLFQGYKDAVFYSADCNLKLKYADSLIWASKKTNNDDLISRAYLDKGVVYYFNFKKYKLALDEYLKAYQYSRNSDDQYYKNRLLYLIAVVKSYIGYYSASLLLFKKTSSFFKAEAEKDMHPNLIHNNRRGYYNSLHQMVVCYRNLGNYRLADSLTNVGLSLTSRSNEYRQEHGYFLKEKGISEFRTKDYYHAISSLVLSLKSIVAVNDFAWATVCYSYIGKSYKAVGNQNDAIEYFKKVDSVFQRHNFILPEMRNTFELLINQSKNEKNIHKELYYTSQLLKADRILNRDFCYLSSRIFGEYDTKILLEEKVKLERESDRGIWVITSLALTAIVLILFSAFTYRSKRQMFQKYRLLEQKILAKNDAAGGHVTTIGAKECDKLGIEQHIVEDILAKLQEFEKNLGFTESGITVAKLAAKLGTNQNYLSQIVNEHKGVNFNRYLSELRIAFITDKLYNDKKYLQYKVSTLADECGIASRTNFSNLFQEFNGMRPTDFIKKRLDDIAEERGGGSKKGA